MLVGRAPIHGCRHVVDPEDEDDGPCPGRWDRLVPMRAHPATRSCGMCGRTVYFTCSASAAQRDLQTNMIVVIDCAVHRSREDVVRPIVRPRPPVIRRPPHTTRSPLELPFFARRALPANVGELLASLEVSPPQENLHEYYADTGHLALPFDASRRRPPIDRVRAANRAPFRPCLSVMAPPPPPPMTDLISRLSVQYRVDPRGAPASFAQLAMAPYDSFHIYFRVGADTIEAHLAAHLGVPLEVQTVPENSSSIYRAYDRRWVFHRIENDERLSSDGCSLQWSQTPQEWVQRVVAGHPPS